MIKGIKKFWRANTPKRIFFEISTYVFVATLPFLVNINTIALWLFIISSILYVPWKTRLKTILNNKLPLLLLVLLYSLYWIGLLYTENVSDGFRAVERTLTLLLIPLVVLSHKKKDFNLKGVFISLGIGLVIVMIICWIAIVQSIATNATPWVQAGYFFEWIYTSWNLVKPIEGHPSYIAILIVFFMSALLISDTFSNFRKNKVVFIVTLLPFFLFLIETSSRISVIALIIIFTVYVIKGMNKNKVISLVLLFVALIVLSIQFDYLGTKFTAMIDNQGNIQFERFHRWKKIITVLNNQDDLLLGVGTGDVHEVYKTAYIEGKFDKALRLNYNAHNQFLEFLTANGVLGPLIFSCVLLFFAFKTKLKKESLFFFILFSLFALSESYFGRSQGVFMFAFFYSFFIVYYRLNNKHAAK